MKWANSTNRHSSGEDLMVGKVNVGGWFYDACRPKSEPNRYRIKTLLPSYKPKKHDFATQDEAKAALEAFTKRWFEIHTKESE